MDAKKLQYYTKKILEERDRITASLSHHEVEFEGAASSRSAEFEEASRLDRDREYISGLLTMDTEELSDINERSSAFSMARTASASIAAMIFRSPPRSDAEHAALSRLSKANEIRQEFVEETTSPQI
jgi:hypothetical protein